MQQKKPYVVLLCVAGVLLAALHTVDLLLWTDEAGFATTGSYWVRLAVWGVAFLLPWLVGRAATAQPAALQDRCPPLGVMMMVCALLLCAAAVGVFPLTLFGGATAWVDFLLPAGAALWLFWYGVRAIKGFGIRRGEPGSALLGLVVVLCFGWQLVRGFQIKPAALPRLPEDLRILAAAAALLFASVLLKVFLTPGQPCGNTIFSAGAACFLLCNCVGLPQTVADFLRGRILWTEACLGFAAAALGLCGLVCCFAAVGPDADADHK